AWHLSNLPEKTYDKQQAEKILVDLGWQRGDDGIFMKEGDRFELTLTTYADRPELTLVATAIQDQWRQIGVDLNIDVTNSSMIPAGHQDDSLEVALIARNYGVIANPLAVIETDFTHGGGDWGAMNWHGEGIAEKLEQLNQIFGEQGDDKSFLMSQAVMQQIYQQKPVLPIAHYRDHIAVNHRVSGFKFDPYSRSYHINLMELSN
ncbi:MAG: ABC transporter substrate-binding protein, partial [Vibrio sp.]